ncbi:PQQ-binding-like beta-propeller repeat protein [Flagellimonas marina]|uniref:PQQ-binding-like beta-propeller repeat protein n=1 Tax=Flagellimonas marina TaxID=1775168 RepID=A0ABV8PME4_9FLAO
MRYSDQEEINLSNVHNLKVAWRYSSEDKDADNRSQNQCNPIVVDGILYGSSPKLKLLALDASTGESKWIFDPSNEDTEFANDPMSFYKVNRGVVYWEDKEGKNKRVFYNVGAKVYGIDVGTGKPIREFGKNGYIDLSIDLDRDPNGYNPFVANTSPGIIFQNLLILGSRVAESADAAPGHIRAFDVMTGERRWIFHTIPHPGEKGYESWPDKDAYKKLGGANSWAGMSLDEKRGIVYVPLGSISGDFYGGYRKGSNLYANSLVALDALTGNYKWHYQTVHHDLWDRDLAANPNLVTLQKDGKEIEAVAQITKHGFVFLFDRETGEPIFPIEERSVPQDGLPGEHLWPTQPIPTLPEPFARQKFEESDVTNLDSVTHKKMLEKYRKIKYKEMFHPPSKDGNWIFPGFDGGGEWGGAAFDPDSKILYVNSSELPWAMVMVDVPKEESESVSKPVGRYVYDKYCLACHGVELEGNGSSYPSLVDIGNKYSSKELTGIMENGINMMPSFSHLSDNEKKALLNFLLNMETKTIGTQKINKEPATSHNKEIKNCLEQIPYQMAGYNRFLDDNGYPGITPPWGTLNAVDLSTGKLLWKVPLGEYAELTAKGVPITGTENYGGPVVTKGGLVFIAATKDSKIRAFDKNTGKVVWEAQLPAPGYATPAVYTVAGKQYIVIACGGGKIGSISGDEYVAFALEE